MTLEDVVADPKHEVKKLMRFLGLHENIKKTSKEKEIPETMQLYWSLPTANKNKVKISEIVARKLDTFYAPYNAELARLFPNLTTYTV